MFSYFWEFGKDLASLSRQFATSCSRGSAKFAEESAAVLGTGINDTGYNIKPQYALYGLFMTTCGAALLASS